MGFPQNGPLFRSSSGLSPDWQDYTPTLTGFGTPSGVDFSFIVIGKLLLVRGNFSSGTPTATEARCSLPTGYTSSNTALPAVSLCGYATWNFNSPNIPTILIEANVAYLTFGAQGTSLTGLTKLNGDAYLGAGQGISFFAAVPVQ